MNITQPTLLIDTQRCQQNIARMYQKAKENKLELRPHFKTHQSHEVGKWYRAQGVQKITVSSLEMAAYFAQDQWEDITVAFPVNILEIATINQLASKIQLNVLVESMEVVHYLKEHLTHPIGVFIKIDGGTKRTGIPLAQKNEILQLAQQIETSSKMTFCGILTHLGHTYQARSKEQILAITTEIHPLLIALKHFLLPYFPKMMLSVGDTPSCSVLEDWEGIDEIRPGNFVFYDLMQTQIGSCGLHQIGVKMACPIVSKHPDRQELIIYGGGVHFSKDRIEHPEYGTIYGLVCTKNNDLIEGAYLKALSQEHGKVSLSISLFNKYEIGDLIYILPIHSCMTANLMKQYLDENANWIAMMNKVN